MRDCKISFGHSDFYVSDQIGKKGKAFRHRLQQALTFGIFTSELFQRITHAKPSWQHMTALHPAKHPWDGAQVLEASGLASARRTRTDPGVFEFFYRRGLFEISQNIRVFDNALAVESKSVLRHFF